VSNVYLVLNYGDFIDGSTNNTANPYVQILPTTNPASAHADFVATRLGGKDTTGAQHFSGSGSGSGSGNKSPGFFQKYRIPIFVVAAGVGIAAFLGAVWFVTRRGKPTYRPLYDPAPAAMPMQTHVTGYNSGYNTGAQYSDPWTHRR